MAIAPEVGDASRAAELRDKLVELIAIPSPSRNERRLADHLHEQLGRTPGVKVERVGDNLVVTLPALHGRPRVLLCGHLDTVPAQDNLEARVVGERVYGLGASDLKAGLAVFWRLIETLPKDDLPLDPAFVLYAREEVAYRESGLLEVSERFPALKRAALAICVEPTDNFVELGCLGTLHAEVTVTGKSAHSARPWLGINAIERALPVLQRVAGRGERRVCFARHPGLEYREVISVTRIEGGRARNVVPDRVVFNVNFRFAPDRTSEDAARLVRELVGGDGSIEFTDVAPSGRVPEHNPICDRLLALAGGRRRAKQAWTDVGRFSVWGVDAVSFGPGLPEQAHQKDEYASVPAMVESLHLFDRLLRGGEASA